jgi:hypothetical protein
MSRSVEGVGKSVNAVVELKSFKPKDSKAPNGDTFVWLTKGAGVLSTTGLPKADLFSGNSPIDVRNLIANDPKDPRCGKVDYCPTYVIPWTPSPTPPSKPDKPGKIDKPKIDKPKIDKPKIDRPSIPKFR